MNVSASRVRVEAAKERFEGSAGGELYSRLVAVDFMNQAFVLAALLMLCVIPFLIFVTAVSGRSFVQALGRYMGLNDAASKSVQSLFGPSANVIAAVSAGSVLFLIVATIGVATVVQGFYLRVFDVDPKDAQSAGAGDLSGRR